jgi:hypothetical protein
MKPGRMRSSEPSKKRSDISLLPRTNLSLLGRTLRAFTIGCGIKLAFWRLLRTFVRISNEPGCSTGGSPVFSTSISNTCGSILCFFATGRLQQFICRIMEQPNPISAFQNSISTPYCVWMALPGGQPSIFEPSKISMHAQNCT